MQLGVNLPGPFFVSGHVPGTGGRPYRARRDHGLLVWLFIAPLLMTFGAVYWVAKLSIMMVVWVLLGLVAAVALLRRH